MTFNQLHDQAEQAIQAAIDSSRTSLRDRGETQAELTLTLTMDYVIKFRFLPGSTHEEIRGPDVKICLRENP